MKVCSIHRLPGGCRVVRYHATALQDRPWVARWPDGDPARDAQGKPTRFASQAEAVAALNLATEQAA